MWKLQPIDDFQADGSCHLGTCHLGICQRVFNYFVACSTLAGLSYDTFPGFSARACFHVVCSPKSTGARSKWIVQIHVVLGLHMDRLQIFFRLHNKVHRDLAWYTAAADLGHMFKVLQLSAKDLHSDWSFSRQLYDL
jgi:hypothetical protein